MKKIIITSIFNLIIITICFTAAAFAWFSTNKKVEGSSITIQVEKSSIVVNHTIYKYDTDEQEFVETNSFDLRPYDMVIRNRNEHSSLILKLEVLGKVIENEDDIILNFLCTDTSSNTRSLSNVTQFKIGLFNTTNINEIESAFENINAHQFLTNAKVTNFTHTVTNYSSYITNGTLLIYVQIDYSDTLIEAFSDISASDLETSINFNPDIYELNLSAGD